MPSVFAKLDGKHSTPRNAIIFCLIVSLSGPILGREALGWFVDMSAIGASMGFFFTSASAYRKMCLDRDGKISLKILSVFGMIFSLIFMILQLVPIPGLSGVHFGKESYLMLLIWITIGIVFYFTTKKTRDKGLE